MAARVTVIVPTFNRAAYLADALASVLQQGDTEFTVLVADNASTDRTAEVVERVGAGRVRYLRRPENVGWIENFNRCLDEVDTEYVTIMGDDDVMLPGALMRAVRALDATPSAGMLHCAFDLIDSDGALLRAGVNWTAGLTADTVEPGPEFIERVMPLMARVCSPTVVMRTKALPLLRFDLRDDHVADYALWVRIALEWSIVFLSTPGLAYRIHRARVSAFYGENDGAEHLFEPESVLALEEAKLRFVRDHSATLDDPRSLRRAARRCTRRELATYSSVMANRSRRDGITAIRRVVGLRTSSMIDPRVWRSAIKVALGPRRSATVSGLFRR